MAITVVLRRYLMMLASYAIGELRCSREHLSDKLYTADTIVTGSNAYSIPEVV
jgi:hypothetical protein